MKLKSFIEEYKPVLIETIQSYSRELSQEYASVPYYIDTLERLLTFSTSGKMLRGIFVLLIYSFFKKLDKKSGAFYAASAIEFIQSGFLIHDDIIDNDKLRRGHKTIYAQYSDFAYQNNYKNEDEFGKNQGICVGDIAFFLASDLLTHSSGSFETIVKLQKLFSKENHLVATGEMIDIDIAANPKDPSIYAITEMYILKTARYSFSLPFMAGALLGGADTGIVQKLEELGENLGIVFQIQDDWLGLFGNEEETGKPVGSDIREKKKTIYRTVLSKSLPASQKGSIDTLSVEETLQLMKKHKVEEKVNEYKESFLKNITTIISDKSFTREQKEVLLEIVELITKRKK